jgi:hypothetical protein
MKNAMSLALGTTSLPWKENRMTLALGRLQLSITFAWRRPRQKFDEALEAPLEHSFRLDRRHQNVVADRERWEADAPTHGGRPF